MLVTLPAMGNKRRDGENCSTLTTSVWQGYYSCYYSCSRVSFVRHQMATRCKDERIYLCVSVRGCSSRPLSFSACDLVRTFEIMTDLFLATGFGAYLSFGAVLNLWDGICASDRDGDGDLESSSLLLLLLALDEEVADRGGRSSARLLHIGLRSVFIGVKKGEE